MDIQNRLLPVKSVTELPSLLTFKREDEESQDEYEVQGRIMEGSKYCWIASGAQIQMVCLQSGRKVAARKFGTSFKNQDTFIMCGCEVPVPASIGTSLIALGLQRGSNDGTICLFTSQGCRDLCTINIGEPVSCICLIDPGGNLAGPLSALDGILAVGTTNGNVLLLDICRQACIDGLVLGPEYTYHENHPRKCLKILPKVGENYEPLREMAQAKGEHLAFSIDAMSFLGQVSSLLMITPLSALVIGSTTGAVAIIDLLEFKLIYKSKPVYGPVRHLAFQEPSDDPRAHCFLWVIHSGSIGTVANLHQLVYRRKQYVHAQSFKYQDFVTAHNPFTLTLTDEESHSVSCQTIHKTITDESTLSLCVFSWIIRSGSYMCIFDMNQWYKSGMPGHAPIDSDNSFFIVYPITLDEKPLNYIDVKLDVGSIMPFKSHQRMEEYYKPGSLSFDCNVLTPNKNTSFHWPGLQVNALRMLSTSGSAGLIVPTPLYLECLGVSLIPMFHDAYYTCESPMAEQRDMLLSLALDFGYIGYLQSCATAWANGSHAGPSDTGQDSGPTLRTMIDWIWKQTVRVKNHTNALSVQLFDNSGISLDATSRRHFTHCISQYEILFTLVRTILESCKEYISPPVKIELESLKRALQTFKEYSEVVQFLLNIGLLPEVINDNGHDTELGPFSTRILKSFYDQRREEINSVKNHSVSWGNEILFIDALIEHECGGDGLRSIWLTDGGSPLYPPDSLQALLYVYLQNDVSTINKHILFVYLFLDLTSILDDERSERALSYLLKFASIFGVQTSVITNTKAFWHLDQKEFKTSLELLIDPLSHTRNLSQWQHNLLLSSLVNQGAFREAMQIMRAPGPHIDPRLQLRILLENNLLCEAFECQRIWGGKELLKTFFEACVRYGNINSIMGLSLTKPEEEELGKFLQKSDSIRADNLRVLYYLQRSRFVEAISVNNNLHHNYSSQHGSPTSNISTRDLIVRAFQNTLPEVTKKLSNYCNRDRLMFEKIRQVENPTPLSVSIVSMATKDPVTKSSVLLEKSVQLNKLQRGVKRILDVEDTPFLRTPKSVLCDRDQKSLLVYPKTITNLNEENLFNGNEVNETATPVKRQKIETPLKHRFSKNKSLRYSLHRLASSPYNFDGNVNYMSSPVVVDKPNEVSFTISTLSSPSNDSHNANLSLLSTPLVKRKNNISVNLRESINITRGPRHSILKVPFADSAKKLAIDSPNVSIPANEASTRSIHFADDASTASEVSDIDMERSSRETSAERSKPSAMGATKRRSLRYSNTSIGTSKTTNSASTGDEIYFSLSSGSNNKGQSESKMLNTEDDINPSEYSSHSENSNDTELSDKQDSNASSEKDLDLNYQEIVKSGPRPRRSLRLSKGNDSLHKLKVTSSASPISKAKSKVNESLTNKLLDLASEQNKYLSRLVLQNNAYKVRESSFKKSKCPRVRDPIHSIDGKSTSENRVQGTIISADEGLKESQSITGKSKTDKNKSNVSFCLQNQDEHNSENDNNQIIEGKEIFVHKSRVSFSSQNDDSDPKTNANETQYAQVNIHDSMLFEDENECVEVASKKDNVYNDIDEENKSEDMDIYEDMMSDINERVRQTSYSDDKDYDGIDVEPMQTCPELILSDDRSKGKPDDESEKNKEPVVEENVCILSATSITLEQYNQIEEANVTQNNEETSKPEEEIVIKTDISTKKLDLSSSDKETEIILIENIDQQNEPINLEATVIPEEKAEILTSTEKEAVTILINSSDESSVSSVEEHNLGAIDLRDTTPNTGSSETTEDENLGQENSEEESYSEESVADQVEHHERKIFEEISGDERTEEDYEISGDEVHIEEDDDQEEKQEEEEDVLFIDEDEEIDEIEKNILEVPEHSHEVLVEVDEQYEENSVSSNSQEGQNDNNNITELLEAEESMESLIEDNSGFSTNINDQGMIINETVQTINEVTVQSSSFVDQTDIMNAAQVELIQTMETENMDQDIIESVDANIEDQEEKSQGSDSNNKILQLSIEDLSTKPDYIEEEHVAIVHTTQADANITEDLSVVEETESDKFISASTKSDEKSTENRKESEKEITSPIKDTTVESENSYADALCESDILDKSYHSEISIIQERDILDKTDLFATENVGDPERVFVQIDMTINPNKTYTDVLDKSHKIEIPVIEEEDCLDKSYISIVETETKDSNVVDSSNTNLLTPKTKERRRSRRLSILSRIDENPVVDEEPRPDDLDSVTSETSVRSTRSLTRRLSTPVRDLGMPTGNTPRRSGRLRSTESSPASDNEASATKTKRKYTRRSSIEASPSVSSPMAAKTKTPTQRGRRRSLLATMTEPVIPEENIKNDQVNENEDISQLVDEYSKERRLTRQQRTMLIRSLGSTDHQSPTSAPKQQTPKKRRHSRSAEQSESGDELPMPSESSQVATTPEGSISSAVTSESARGKRSCFLKARDALKTTDKKIRRNSEKDGNESEFSVASVTSSSSKVSYKFSAPTEVHFPAKGEELVTLPGQEFCFSPPRHPYKGLPTIDEERSLSPVVCLEKVKEEKVDEVTEPDTVTKSTKKGRPRKNSTSSNKSQTTRTSSRNSNK